MSKRKIIKIDEEKCDGCGLCIPDCPEGALKIIDGKARLVSDLFCDGLGACIGSCPRGAIAVEEREAVEYNERQVMANIAKQGRNVIKAHLKHLKDHNQHRYLQQALDFLRENKIEVPLEEQSECGCPSANPVDFRNKAAAETDLDANIPSQLRQWPVQLRLISPAASYYQGADVLLVADCVAYALGDFHLRYLKGKSVAIACPKLDADKDVYLEKIKSWFEDAKINTLTVIIMQVPCCKGLLGLAEEALKRSKRKVPLKVIVVGLEGDILKEEWL